MSEEVFGFGRGHVRMGKHKQLVYIGTIPYEDGEEVILLKKSDLEKMVSTEYGMLKASQLPMPEVLSNPKTPVHFPVMLMSTSDGGEHRLYLDPHFYTDDPFKCVWIRYESVEQAVEEEHPFGERTELH